MTSTPSRARRAVLGVVATAFVLLLLRNILFGVYSWHIRQPEFTQVELSRFCGVLPTVGGGFQHAETEAPLPG